MATTIKSLTADLEAANLQNDALTQELSEAQRQFQEYKAELQRTVDEAQAKQESKPWSNITGQKILLPASMDAKRYNGKPAVKPGEYDGIKTLDVTVHFMAGNRIGRAYDLTFRDNGHGPLATKAQELIESGNLEQCIDARFRCRIWNSPDGREVPFDSWEVINVFDVPEPKQRKQSTEQAELKVEAPAENDQVPA
jgi:hypothetical protein